MTSNHTNSVTSVQCSVAVCERAAVARGWCTTHYGRWRRHGDVTKITQPKQNTLTPEQALRDRGWIVKDYGCWEVLGSRTAFGYGSMRHRDAGLGAHRLAYVAWVGELDKASCVLHHCDNPPCINPEHLYAGTKKQNAQDRADRQRHPRQKLTAADREAMLTDYRMGLLTHQMLGDIYGVSRSRAGHVLRKEITL